MWPPWVGSTWKEGVPWEPGASRAGRMAEGQLLAMALMAREVLAMALMGLGLGRY